MTNHQPLPTNHHKKSRRSHNQRQRRMLEQMSNTNQPQYTPNDGIVYLIHLDQPLSPNHTAQHYLGWAGNLAALLETAEKEATPS